MAKRRKLEVSSLSALRLARMESISLAISSNLAKRALSLMLALIHLSISLLAAFPNIGMKRISRSGWGLVPEEVEDAIGEAVQAFALLIPVVGKQGKGDR